MVTLVLRRPHRTTEARIEVDAGLPPGRHRFQLEVFDAAGLCSQPSIATLLIARLATPPDPPRPPLAPVPPIVTRPPLAPVPPIVTRPPLPPIGPVPPIVTPTRPPQPPIRAATPRRRRGPPRDESPEEKT